MAAPFDVILLGPTGVTGREVARYLAHRAPQLGLTWAVAGRDRDRIDAVLGRVGATPDGVVQGDVADATSIDALVEQGRVVANLVGPYARYGEPVHRACARAGVHQLDLTGEIDWVRQMIDRHEPTAMASGAALRRLRVVAVRPRRCWPRTPRQLHRDDTAVLRLAGDRGRRRRRVSAPPRRHTGTGAWLAPLFPSPLINPPVLHRSAALLRADGDAVFAPDYRYREGTFTASMLGPADVPGVAPVASAAMAFGQAAVTGAQLLPKVIRSGLADALSRLGPSPGTGPRAETLDEWSYRIDVHAVTASGDTADVTVDVPGRVEKTDAGASPGRRSRVLGPSVIPAIIGQRCGAFGAPSTCV